jgi:glycoside/pentoside/hexuronide:cation symporter, GPH family
MAAGTGTHSSAVNSGQPAGERLPLGLCVGFGVGSLGIAIMLNAVTTFFPVLMTTVLGQSAALAGLLLTLSKLYDALADIVIGMASDRTKTRIGRRRPYLVAGAIVSGLSMLLIFIPPEFEGWALTFWMAFALVIYSTGYSLFAVPYVAMAGEMTDGYHERTRLLSFRAFFIGLGQLIASAGIAALMSWVGGGRSGYAAMGAVAGFLIASAMLASFFGTRAARIAETKPMPHVSRSEALKTLATNRPFVLLMVIKLSQYTGIASINTAKLLFLLNVVHTGYMGLVHLTFVQNIATVLTVPFWAWAGRTIGKRPAYMLSTLTLVVAYGSWYWTGPGITLPEIWVRGALNGIAAAGTALLSVSMLPDVMEYDRLRTGARREGVFSSLYTIVEKLGYALGAGLVGVILSTGGFVPTLQGAVVQQPDTAINALYISASLLPAGFILFSWALMWFYPLDQKMLEREAAEAEARGTA